MRRSFINIINKINSIFRGEVIFALFLLAGNFKSSLTFLPDYLDVTILFFTLSILISAKRLIIKPSLLKEYVHDIAIYLTFIAVLLGSLFYTPSTIYSLDKVLRFLIITSWAFLGVFFLIKNEDSLKRFLNTIIFLGLIMSGVAIYQFIFVQKGNWSFISVLGSNYLALGRTVGIGIIIVFLYFINENKRFKSILFILAILQMSIALLISGGKMPVLSIVVVLFLYFIFSSTSNRISIYLRNGMKKVIVLTIILVPIIIVLGRLGMFDVVISRLSELILSIGKDTSALGRIDRYITALKMWGDKPLIGNGVGSFPIFYSGFDVRDYPHNIFLEILCELGILGFGIFTWWIGTSFYKGWVIFKNKFKGIDHLQMGLILVFLYLLINANVSGSLNDNRLMFTFIGLLSISPYLGRKAGDSDENMYIDHRS
ncbi:O-antigen ligase family protein [Clostridium sp. D2Q-11]|uniref:O-antigen ligase family protein n=1 Tax=Anaeromonas frigoriresistens TaxID=2683708 RepID=A0A942UYU6_9FIRM|nr:O-antigen ligase family protein [Anaeromonas frigoriresistens]MBS4538831.1 O-antigen ligase family protein [Anaeromonas frigoriresistens]